MLEVVEEAERLCGRLIIIDHGKVIADDTLSGLYRLGQDLGSLRHFRRQAGKTAGSHDCSTATLCSTGLRLTRKVRCSPDEFGSFSPTEKLKISVQTCSNVLSLNRGIDFNKS
jgi:ABC-type multidrug transport system ATPase subunit